jgi:hypothetical protein
MPYRYYCDKCGKTYVGPMLSGKMECNCQPPRQISGTELVTPLSAELLQDLDITAANELRNRLCTAWGIKNKSHTTHGSNFSGNQTVIQLINNIIKPVEGDLWEKVRAHIIRDYSYDINSGKMTY